MTSGDDITEASYLIRPCKESRGWVVRSLRSRELVATREVYIAGEDPATPAPTAGKGNGAPGAAVPPKQKRSDKAAQQRTLEPGKGDGAPGAAAPPIQRRFGKAAQQRAPAAKGGRRAWVWG